MLENRMKKLEAQVETVEYHQKKVNLVIYNLDENQGENPKTIVSNFFTSILKVSNEDIPKIKVDVAHRIGYRSGRGPRQMLVKLRTLDSKVNLMGYVKNLQGTKFSISQQLPKEMQERRSAQITQLKQARANNPGVTCKLVKDKLIVGNEVINPNFEDNPLSPQTTANFSKTLQKIRSSNIMNEKRSRFQAHAMDITCREDAEEGLAAVIKNHPAATHRVYAFKYTDPMTGLEVTGNSDDGEWGASRHILQSLRQAGTSKLIVITRYYGGLKLGYRRFEIYRMAAHAAAAPGQ